MFQLKIHTEGAAFRDCQNGEQCEFAEAAEIVRIFGEVSHELEMGRKKGTIRDSNGNKIGSWSR